MESAALRSGTNLKISGQPRFTPTRCGAPSTPTLAHRPDSLSTIPALRRLQSPAYYSARSTGCGLQFAAGKPGMIRLD
jgi:hypothetical protein